jgi:hypothetical protein
MRFDCREVGRLKCGEKPVGAMIGVWNLGHGDTVPIETTQTREDRLSNAPIKGILRIVPDYFSRTRG